MSDSVANSIKALSSNQSVLLIDDVSNQFCCYLIHCALNISDTDVVRAVNIAGGLSLAAISEEKIAELSLSMMPQTGAPEALDLTVSVEARRGVSTGISAADRGMTLRTLSSTQDPKLDLVTPGHIFPVRAKKGGVLIRTLPAEAAIDLMHLAGLPPVCAMTQCLNTKGDIASDKEIQTLSKEQNLCCTKISSIIQHRLNTESIVELCSKKSLSLKNQVECCVFCFRSKIDGCEHLAITMGSCSSDDGTPQKPILTRVQSEELVSDVLGFDEFSSRNALSKSIQKISQSTPGVFVYVRHPHNLSVRQQPSDLNKEKTDVCPGSQLRELGIGAQILRSLGVRRIKLLTNSTREISGIEAFGIEIIGRESF